MSDKRSRPVMKVEELDQAVEELLRLARNEGKALRRGAGGRVFTQRSSMPNISDLLRDDLRSALEDEVLPAVPVQESWVDPTELSHEIMKKALIGLKLSVLKEIARERQLLVGGSSEALAGRIADFYGWDETEIARLVLSHEEEPSPERGHTDRIFPLLAPPQLSEIIERLDPVQGRYVRIGVARWFVFDWLQVNDDELRLGGTLRSYQAAVDDVDDEAKLTAVPSEHDARAILASGERVLRVAGAGVGASRAFVHALDVVGRVRPLAYVPLLAPDLGGATAALDRTSLFMLDLLQTRFREAGLHDLNLTVARFKVSSWEPELILDEDDRRPTLRAVRFEGTHLLDSTPACRLLADEGRALVEMALVVRIPGRADRPAARFPIRIGVESDHVVVATGFGTGQPELSLSVHRSVVAAVIDEIQGGFADAARLEDLAERIRRRAAADQEPEEADMLAESDE